jgi:hypothetical protein
MRREQVERGGVGQKNGADRYGDFGFRCFDDRADGSHGRATANGRAGSDEAGGFAFQFQFPAEPKPESERAGDGDEGEQRAVKSEAKDHWQVDAETEKHHAELQ